MSSNGTILIIEDQPGFRHIYREFLESSGYEVLEAEDGEAGWELIQSKKPHLILLDLKLPKLDGFEVLERTRANAETKNIPVLIFSVLGEQSDVKRGMMLGANAYTIKGFFTPKQILSKIRELMTTADGKKIVNSYKMHLKGMLGDGVKLQKEMGLTQGYQCSECKAEITLELFTDHVSNEGTWFTAHFVCSQ